MERPICPNCGSKNVYYRRILQEFACRKCGHTWKEEEVTGATRGGKQPK